MFEMCSSLHIMIKPLFKIVMKIFGNFFSVILHFHSSFSIFSRRFYMESDNKLHFSSVLEEKSNELAISPNRTSLICSIIGKTR